MTLTCPKCGATHAVDAPTHARRALRFRCTECGHAFHVEAPQLEAPSAAGLPVSVGPGVTPASGAPTGPHPPTVVVDVRPDTILSVLAGADTWAVDSSETLLAWILEGRVLPEDVGLEASGRRTVLAARPALAPFFAAARVLDDVRAGRLVPAPATPPAGSAGRVEGTLPLAEPPHAPPPAEEDSPFEALVPPPDLAEDPPTMVMSPETLEAMASRVGSAPIPLAELLAGDGAGDAVLPRDETVEQAHPAPPPQMAFVTLPQSPTEEATVAVTDGRVAPPEPSARVDGHAETTTGIPAPVEPDPFAWDAPPPPAPPLPWGRVAIVGIVIAGLAAVLLRGSDATTTVQPPPAASAPSVHTPAASPPAASAASVQTPAAGAPAPTPVDVVGKPPVAPVPTPAAANAPVTPPAPAPAAPAPRPAAATGTPAPAPAPTAAPPRPRNAAALVKAGWGAVEAGDLAKARGMFADAVAAGGGATALHGRGYTLQQLGDIEGAVKDYCAALAANPPGDVRAEAQTFLQRSKRSCPSATP